MRHHTRTGTRPRRGAGHWRVVLVGVLALFMLAACGQSSTTGAVAPTATDTATPTFAPTATSTATPIATQTPAHMIVRVTPDPSRCASSCSPYICTSPGGASCPELLFCSTVTAFPFFEVSNSGQLPLTWTWSVTLLPGATPTSGSATLTVTPNGGMVPGGSAVAVTLNADKILTTNGPGVFNLNFTGGGVTTTVQAACAM